MASTINVGVLRALLTADTAQFESGLRDAAGSVKKFESEARKLGQNLSTIGTQMTAMVTLPIVAAFGTAAKAAIDFESSFAGVRKTVDASEPEFQAMAQQFRDLAKTIPVSVHELNRLGEAAGALGIPKDEIVDFSRVMAELGVTTNVTSDQAAESIAKIQTQFKSAGKETENFASTLVDLGNKGSSTEADILSLATRVASAGQAIGLSQAQVLGWSAAMANVGIEAEAGGSAISRIFVEISKSVSKGGDALTKFAVVAGMTGKQFNDLFRKDANAAMEAFIQGLGRVVTSGQDLNVVLEKLGFTELRQADTLRRLAQNTDNVSNSLKVATAAWRENSALSTEAGKRFETTASQMTLLWNRIKDVGITIGNALLPAIKSANQVIGAMIPWLESAANLFAAMPGPIQAVVLGFFALAAAAGPLLFVFGQMALGVAALTGVGGFAGLAAKATALVPSLSLVGAAIGAIRVAVVGLMGPWGLLALAVGAIVKVLWDQAGGWEGISKAIQPVIQFVKDLGLIFWEFAKQIGGTVITAITDLTNAILFCVDALIGWIGAATEATGLKSRWDMLKEHATSTFRAIASEAAAAADMIRNLAIIDKEHAALIKKRDASIKGQELPVPDASKLAEWDQQLERGLSSLRKIPKPVTDINALLKDTTKETDAAKKAADEAAEAHREWKRIVAANEKVFEQQAKEAGKFFEQERKLAEHKADEQLRSFNAARQAERDLTKVARDNAFDRAEFAIDMAKKQGATWQDVYAMETELSAARLQAAIDDAELEFEIRTLWIDRTTQFGADEYERLRQVHDEKIQGMVGSHQRGEMAKRAEIERTHNQWIQLLDRVRGRFADLGRDLTSNLGSLFFNLGFDMDGSLRKAAEAATQSYEDVQKAAAKTTEEIAEDYAHTTKQIEEDAKKKLEKVEEAFIKVRDSGTASAEEIEAAFQERAESIQQINEDTAHKLKEAFEKNGEATKKVADDIHAKFEQMREAEDAAHRSWGERFLEVWQSIKRTLFDVFNDILSVFVNTFLKGMLGAILGQQGAFSNAFAGLFSGLFGGGGGAGGLLGAGGNAATGGILAGLFGGGANSAVAGVLAGNSAIAGVTAGGAGAAGAAGAGTGGSALAALMTNPWTIGIAAAIIGGLTIWKTGFGRGGEEGTKVNPQRDADIQRLFQSQFGGSQFEAMAKAFADAGVSGDIAERLIADLYAADTMKEYTAALEAMNRTIAEAKAATDDTSAAVQMVAASFTQFQATISSVEVSGQASEMAIARLRQSIRGLEASNVSAEIVQHLNTQLTAMVASGTASDDALAGLTSQIEQLTAQAGPLEKQIVDTAEATATTAEGMLEAVGMAMHQFQATVSSLQLSGMVSGEAIEALRAAIADLKESGVSAETLEALNATLNQMIAEGTASDEAIGSLIDQIVQMTESGGDLETQVDDTTDATSDLEREAFHLEGQLDATGEMTDFLGMKMGQATDAAGDFSSQLEALRAYLSQPIQLPEIHLPEIHMTTGGGGGGGGGAPAPPDGGGGGDIGGGDSGGGDVYEPPPPPVYDTPYGFAPWTGDPSQAPSTYWDDNVDHGGYPSFANEGIVTNPTLAMVGDASVPEWILHEPSVMGLLKTGFSFGASMLDALTSSLPSFGDVDLTPAFAGAGPERGGGDTFNLAAKIVIQQAPGESSRDLSERLVTDLPRAMRRHHELVRNIRTAVKG